MTKIAIQFLDPHNNTVVEDKDVEIIGQCYIFPALRGWVVGFVNDGSSLAGFSVKHVAIAFAKEIDEFDLDTILPPENPPDRELAKELLDFLDKRARHKTFFNPERV